MCLFNYDKCLSHFSLLIFQQTGHLFPWALFVLTIISFLSDRSTVAEDVMHNSARSTPSKISKSNYLLLALGFFVCLTATTQYSFAEVFIPSHEYVSYFYSNGIYTVIGNVKNDLDYAIIPTVTV